MEQQNNSFLSSALLFALIFGVVTTAISLVLGYRTIGSEPTGSFFSPMMLIGIVSCLVGMFAGLMAVRHHVGEFNQPLATGRGAIIGLVTGLLLAVVVAVLSLIWNIIDPNMNENLMNAMIANVEAMQNIPDSAKQDMIDSFYTEFQRAKTLAGQLRGLAINGVFLGVLNLINGIIGVKIFSPKPENEEI